MEPNAGRSEALTAVPPQARGHVTVPGHSASAGTVFSADSSCDRDDQLDPHQPESYPGCVTSGERDSLGGLEVLDVGLRSKPGLDV